jgi:hypothetical protein
MHSHAMAVSPDIGSSTRLISSASRPFGRSGSHVHLASSWGSRVWEAPVSRFPQSWISDVLTQSTVAFSAATSIATIGLYISYGQINCALFMVPRVDDCFQPSLSHSVSSTGKTSSVGPFTSARSPILSQSPPLHGSHSSRSCSSFPSSTP